MSTMWTWLGKRKGGKEGGSHVLVTWESEAEASKATCRKTVGFLRYHPQFTVGICTSRSFNSCKIVSDSCNFSTWVQHTEQPLYWYVFLLPPLSLMFLGSLPVAHTIHHSHTIQYMCTLQIQAHFVAYLYKGVSHCYVVSLLFLPSLSWQSVMSLVASL